MTKSDLKMMCRYSLRLALRILEKFSTVKGAKRYVKIILMAFFKKISFWAN